MLKLIQIISNSANMPHLDLTYSDANRLANAAISFVRQDGIEYLLSAREEDPFEDMPGRYAWEQAGAGSEIDSQSLTFTRLHPSCHIQIFKTEVSLLQWFGGSRLRRVVET